MSLRRIQSDSYVLISKGQGKSLTYGHAALNSSDHQRKVDVDVDAMHVVDVDVGAYQSMRLNELNALSTNLSECQELRLTQRSSRSAISSANESHVKVLLQAVSKLSLV